jgi:hypothetical protein
MQVIKPIAIVIAVTVALMMIGQQTVQATSDTFRVRVTLEGVDSLTGRLKVEVTGADGTGVTRTVDSFKEGRTGNVQLADFVLPASSTRVTEIFDVCVYALDYNVVSNCERDENTVKKAPEEITVEVPSGIGRVGDNSQYDDTTYYDEEPDNEDVTEVSQGADSNAVDNNQGTGVTVSIGDDSDNNNITVDQRTTFGDVVRELLPIAKKAGSAVKNTAVEILN